VNCADGGNSLESEVRHNSNRPDVRHSDANLIQTSICSSGCGGTDGEGVADRCDAGGEFAQGGTCRAMERNPMSVCHTRKSRLLAFSRSRHRSRIDAHLSRATVVLRTAASPAPALLEQSAATPTACSRSNAWQRW